MKCFSLQLVNRMSRANLKNEMKRKENKKI